MGEIADRVEGKARQEIAVADITRELGAKSDAELMFHLENSRWPEDNELPAPDSRQNEVEE
jgi:hypothetical protein